MNKIKWKNVSYGFLEIETNKNNVCISYCGNMGAEINSVNKCLEALNLPVVEKIREMYKHKETGSPDYSWSIEFPNYPK